MVSLVLPESTTGKESRDNMLAFVPYRKLGCSVDLPFAAHWLDRFFDETSPSVAEGQKRLLTEFDVLETDEHIIVKADLPGMDIANIDINVTDNTLTLTGEKKEEREEKKEQYQVSERRFGSFCRSFRLPGDVKADETDATYENGVLRVSIPKSEGTKSRRIEVKAH